MYNYPVKKAVVWWTIDNNFKINTLSTITLKPDVYTIGALKLKVKLFKTCFKSCALSKVQINKFNKQQKNYLKETAMQGFK